MTTAGLLTTVRGEISGVLDTVAPAEMSQLADRLAAADRVFLTGEGRSGFMAKAFAMRLMHLGLRVYVIGETTTPSVGAGDTVVAVSGSGTTAATVRIAEQARSVGAALCLVTTAPDAPLGQLADFTLTIPAATKHRRTGEAATVQPLSSLFDQATHIVLDVVCLELAGRRGVDNAQARSAHSNTE